MPAKKDDLEKIGDVLLDFFKTQRIRDTLESIHKFGVSGWEKWWQTELALYLAGAEQTIAEWDMEHPFDIDKRTRLTQSRMAVDIGFRLKRHAIGDWHFVELKQHDDYRRCIDRMCKDAAKIFSARTQSFDGIRIRYIACAGAFLTVKDEQDVRGYLDAALEDFDIDADGAYLKPIGKHHSVLVF